MDIVQLVKNGKGIFEWAEVVSEHNGYKLYIKVFRDAMKFDAMPAMTWHRDSISGDSRVFNGVRLPASAYELQQIADLLDCMLLTPKVIDLIWLQAELKFDCIVNINGQIVATSNIHDVHNKIEEKISSLGGDDGTKLVSCVGKYWCLINGLGTDWNKKAYGANTACNYGWFAKRASGPCISPGTQCFQRPGFRHDHFHYDPSQCARLMRMRARLIHPNGDEELVDLNDIAGDPCLAPLISHNGVLTYLRQKNVPYLESIDIYDPIPAPAPAPAPEPIEPEPPKKENNPKEIIEPNLLAQIIKFILTLLNKKIILK